MAEVTLRLGNATAVVPAPPAAADAPSETGGETIRRFRLELNAAAEDLRKLWRDQISRMPPAIQERWLTSQEAASALGARRCAKLLRQLRDGHLLAELLVPSGAWLEAYDLDGATMPQERMTLSGQCVRYGHDGTPHQRYTPSHCVALEDFIDSQTPERAEYYRHPPSPSAVAIARINAYGKADMKPIAKRRKTGRGMVKSKDFS